MMNCRNFLLRFRLRLSFPLPGLSESESVAETNLGLDEELPESESVAETNLGLDEELPDPENERDLERLKQVNFRFRINLFFP